MIFGAMPPPIYTPPRAPNASAMLPAKRPSQVMNWPSAAPASASPEMASATTSTSCGVALPLAAADGLDAERGDLDRRSPARPRPARLMWRVPAESSSSASSRAPSETCPPSPATAIQRSPDHKRPATPSPVPGPSTTLVACGSVSPADLVQLGRRERRQRQRQRLEIVQHVDRVEAGSAAKLILAERPVRIGERDALARNRTGNRERRGSRLERQRGHISGERRFDRAMPAAQRLADMRERERHRIGQGETRIGAADIGDQHWLVQYCLHRRAGSAGLAWRFARYCVAHR